MAEYHTSIRCKDKTKEEDWPLSYHGQAITVAVSASVRLARLQETNGKCQNGSGNKSFTAVLPLAGQMGDVTVFMTNPDEERLTS